MLCDAQFIVFQNEFPACKFLALKSRSGWLSAKNQYSTEEVHKHGSITEWMPTVSVENMDRGASLGRVCSLCSHNSFCWPLTPGSQSEISISLSCESNGLCVFPGRRKQESKGGDSHTCFSNQKKIQLFLCQSVLLHFYKNLLLKRNGSPLKRKFFLFSFFKMKNHLLALCLLALHKRRYFVKCWLLL